MRTFIFGAARRCTVHVVKVLLGTLLVVMPVYEAAANDFCPDVYKAGRFGPLNINAAFMHIDDFTNPDGTTYHDLIVTSFFNVVRSADGRTTESFFERDLVARIPRIGFRSSQWFDKDRDVEILTDLTGSPVAPNGPGQQVWPNEAQKVPDGILPFQAIVSPQGFMPTPSAGRLTLINMDDPAREEYTIHQTLQGSAPCVPQGSPGHDPGTKPAFYHLVKWFDMDGDGLKDAVTVRSGFKLVGATCGPTGEVVWYKNPGEAITPATGWEEFVVAGYPFGADVYADITLDMHDFEGDGVPEIVGTHFFTGETISLYGAPVGQTWADVDLTLNPPRFVAISADQGAPFGAIIEDLNRDGKMDIVATNHQGDDCFAQTRDPIPGRVYALEQPASGNLFTDPWPVHVLKDNIRPNPTFPSPQQGPPGRLAPGLAIPFWPTPFQEAFERPWLLVGGDEASKVWVLKPASQDPNDWTYLSAVIFDINDYYGANTTQSFTAPPPATGVSISTIGIPAWRYDNRNKPWRSKAEIYIPIFEGRDIIRISFRNKGPNSKIVCPPDGSLACPLIP